MVAESLKPRAHFTFSTHDVSIVFQNLDAPHLLVLTIFFVRARRKPQSAFHILDLTDNRPPGQGLNRASQIPHAELLFISPSHSSNAPARGHPAEELPISRTHRRLPKFDPTSHLAGSAPPVRHIYEGSVLSYSGQGGACCPCSLYGLQWTLRRITIHASPRLS